MAAPLCQECLQRPARAWTRKGKPKVVKDHDLCDACWFSLRDSRRAAVLKEEERAGKEEEGAEREEIRPRKKPSPPSR